MDIFLLCSKIDLQWQAFEEMVHLQENDPIHDQLAIDSQNRLQSLRERFFLSTDKSPDLDVVGCEEYQQLSQWVAAEGA